MENLIAESMTLDSREVAEMLNKEHRHLLRDIAKYSEYLTESKVGLSDFFQESQYKDSTGRTLKCYRVTKKGCEFLAHKLTGRKGTVFTAIYINKFHAMEKALKRGKHTVFNPKLMIPLDKTDEWNALKKTVETLLDKRGTVFSKMEKINRSVIELSSEISKILGMTDGIEIIFDRWEQGKSTALIEDKEW